MTQFELLQTEPSEGVLVFGMSGEIDLGTVRPFKEAAEAAVDRDYRELVFDLSRVEFIDSSGLHVLASAHKRMAAKGGKVTVVCTSPLMRRVFEITELDTLLTIVETRDEALGGHAAPA
jgi:anti-anti-sigma factor